MTQAKDETEKVFLELEGWEAEALVSILKGHTGKPSTPYYSKIPANRIQKRLEESIKKSNENDTGERN
jgi:hypothetical protein